MYSLKKIIFFFILIIAGNLLVPLDSLAVSIKSQLGEGTLEVDLKKNKAVLEISGLIFSSKEDWTIKKIDKKVFYIQHASWHGFGYAIDSEFKTFSYARIDKDGNFNVRENSKNILVEILKGTERKPEKVALHFDDLWLYYTSGNKSIRVKDQTTLLGILWTNAKKKNNFKLPQTFTVLNKLDKYYLKHKVWNEDTYLQISKSKAAEIVVVADWNSLEKKKKSVKLKTRHIPDKKVSSNTAKKNRKVLGTVSLGSGKLMYNPESSIAMFFINNVGIANSHDWKVTQNKKGDLFIKSDGWSNYALTVNSDSNQVKKIYLSKNGKINRSKKPVRLDISATIRRNGKTYSGLDISGLEIVFENWVLNHYIFEKEEHIQIYDPLSKIDLIPPTKIKDARFKIKMTEAGNILKRSYWKEGKHIVLTDKKLRFVGFSKFTKEWFSTSPVSGTSSLAKSASVTSTVSKEPASRTKGGSSPNKSKRIVVDSPWHEDERASYSKILAVNRYDYLVVPFESASQGIDRQGRYLMTRYLADEIQRSYGVTVADIDFVSKSLGSGLRAFDDDKISELAKLIDAKNIIRCNVAHDMKLHLKVDCKRIKVDKSSSLKNSITINAGLEKFEFSDAVPPSEKFKSHIPTLIKRLTGKSTKKIFQQKYNKLSGLKIPKTLVELKDLSPKSLLEQIYYLQLMGTFYPIDSYSKQSLFERSLVLLRQVSPKSPDYKVMKARALFNLYRRPAALQVLGKVRTLEERSFYQNINGNLPETVKLIDKITEDHNRYIAKIEFATSNFNYKNRNFSRMQKYAETIVDKSLVKNMTIPYMQAVLSSDAWKTIPNSILQVLAEKVFPLNRIEKKSDITMASRYTGPQNHVNKFLDSKGESLALRSNSVYLKGSDFLDYISLSAIRNIINAVNLEYYHRGLQNLAFEILDSVEDVYEGNPYYMETYYRLASIRHGFHSKSRRNMSRSVKSAFDRAYRYSEILFTNHEELSWLTYNARILKFTGKDLDVPVYRHAQNLVKNVVVNDFPSYHRSYMTTNERIKDRKRFKYSFSGESKSIASCNNILNYSSNILDFETCHGNFKKTINKKVFLDVIDKRFNDYPKKVKILEAVYKKDHDSVKLLRFYEKVFKDDPTNSDVMTDLAFIYYDKLDVKKAIKLYDTYIKEAKGKVGIVKYSNQISAAGSSLIRRGETEIAKKYLEEALKNPTGSHGNISSAAYLATITGNYYAAMKMHESNFNRYYTSKRSMNISLDNYLSFLNVFGEDKKVELIYSDKPYIGLRGFTLVPLVRSYRIKKYSQEKIINELIEYNKKTKIGFGPRNYSMHLHAFVDRELTEEGISGYTNQYKSLQTIKSESVEIRKALTNIMKFREGDYSRNFKTGSFETVNNWFSKLLYPYAVASYVISTGNGDIETLELSKLLAEEKSEIYLGKMVASGIKGDHLKALEYLKGARLGTRGYIHESLKDWYAILEMLEFLYKRTKHKAYLDELIKWSKHIQLMAPFESFGYSFEAKHSKDKFDKNRALGFTLFLDSKSSRISHFTNSDKTKASKWFKSNNPFIKTDIIKRNVKQES